LGGTNAHAVFEQYLCPENERHGKSGPFIIPLSAKNADRLKAYTQKFYFFLKSASIYKEIRISDLAYTFQVGREVMENRVAFLVESKDDLILKLEEFNCGTEKINNCFIGSGKGDFHYY